MTIPEIFAQYGEQHFRDGERRVIARLIEDAGGKIYHQTCMAMTPFRHYPKNLTIATSSFKYTKLGAGFYGRLGNLVLYPPWWLAQNIDQLEATQASSPITKS